MLLENAEDGFDDIAFSEHDFIKYGNEVIGHVFANACDEMQSLLPHALP